jgi:hypothetical protein
MAYKTENIVSTIRSPMATTIFDQTLQLTIDAWTVGASVLSGYALARRRGPLLGSVTHTVSGVVGVATIALECAVMD